MSRADKKEKVAPIIPTYLRKHVHAVHKFMGMKSDDEAGVKLVMAALHFDETLEQLKYCFFRDYAFGRRFFPGHQENKGRVKQLVNFDSAVLERLTLRFCKDDYALIDALAVGLGCSLSFTTALLLYYAYTLPGVTEWVAPGYRTPSEYALQGVGTWASSTRVSPSRA